MKYKHHPDTLIVLNDIKNRLDQFIEVGGMYAHVDPELAAREDQAFRAARTIVQQAIDTGHVFRGSWAVPDGLLWYPLKTKSPDTVLNSSVKS